MRGAFRTAALVLVSLACAAGSSAAGLALTGRLHTEGAAGWVRVQAWPTGEASLERDPLAGPLVEAKVAPGAPFSVALPEGSELPVRVEVDAPGHVGACVDVALPEQLELQPLWLPAGEPLEIAVTEDGKAVKGARVWGSMSTWPPSQAGPGGWSPCLVSQVSDAAGHVEAFALDTATGGELFDVGLDGRWGRGTQGLTAHRLAVTLDSRRAHVVVRDGNDRPVVGVRVADARAPAGLAAITDEAGEVDVQVRAEGDWSLVALGRGLVGRRRLHGAPRGTVAVRVEALPTLDVAWRGPGEAILAVGWLPEALAPRVAAGDGGRTRVPWLQEAATALEAVAPGFAPELRRIGSNEMAVALAFAPEVRVKGTVVDADDRPAAGLPVWLEMSPFPGGRGGNESLLRLPLPSAVSDAQGRFSIPGLPTGPLVVVATRAGSPEAASARLEPAAGAIETVSLKLARGLAVTLRVSDGTGMPVPGAVVTGWQGGDMGIRMLPRRLRARIERASAEASTDPEGRATLAGLAKGDVSLQVSLPGFVPAWKDAMLEETDLDLGEVVLEPGFDLEGRVLDEAGQPVADAHVSYGDRPDGLISGGETATTNGEGRFVIPDLPRTGELWLEARAEGMIAESPARVKLPPDEPVELHLRPARSLEGRVVDEADGSPISGASVYAQKSVQYSRSGVHFSLGRSSGHATSDEDGRFVVDGLEPGRFDVRASAEGYRSVRVEAVIPDQERPRPVTLPLAEGLEIRGHLVDGSDAPVAGVSVRCRTADSGGYAGGTASGAGAYTGPEGEFALPDLAPGDYVLQAEGEGGARARAQAAAGARDVLLRLEPPGAVLVRVVDPDGDPVSGAEVAMRVASGRLTRQSDGGGQARFDAIPPATVHVSARAEGWSRGTGEVRVESGRTAETTIALSAGGVVEGAVLGLDADQLARCMVMTSGASDRPDGDGRFRLEGVPLGRAEVRASVFNEGRSRSVVVELSDADEPVEVELDFAKGVTVSGRVRRAGRGLANARVDAGTPGRPCAESVIADEDGRFEIQGLDPGPLEVVASDTQGRALVSKTVTAETDAWVDLEVPDGALSGRVISRETRRPVVGATVELRSSDTPPISVTGRSEADGSFHLEPLGDGSWTVRTRVDGYTDDDRVVELSGGVAPEVTIELDPEHALELVVHDVDGSVPDQIWVLAQPAAGGRVASRWVACDRDGKARVLGLPQGPWVVLVEALGIALVQAQVPSTGVPVALQPLGSLEMLPPTDAPAPGWQARLIQTGTGLVLPAFSRGSSLAGGWRAVDPRGDTARVPVGAWTVEALDPPGQARRYDVQVAPGTTTTVRLE